MKFKFDRVGKISSKIRIFLKENLIRRKMLKWDQDHDLLWKLANQDPIIFAKLSTLIILLKKIKNIRQLRRIRLIQKLVILLWRWYGQRRFRGSDQWEPKPARSLSKIEADQRKAKKLLWDRNICSRSHQKRYSWIYTKKIIIIINYSIKKWHI